MGSGVIYKLKDGRKAIRYHHQELASKGFFLLHLIDENNNHVIKNRKPLTLVQRPELHEKTIRESKIIGYVD